MVVISSSAESFKNYRRQLNYTTCNEDSVSELKALKIGKDDIVLCITGSGGRTLNHLTAEPRKIYSIDFNPVQNWLLELKMAAIKNLKYGEYAQFLGLFACRNRWEMFEHLSSDLSEESLKFWRENKHLITKGILYQGKFERHYRLSSDFIKLFRRKKIKRMLSFTDIEKQRAYYDQSWNNRFWQFLLALDSSKANYERTIKDPAFFLFVAEDFDYKKFFHERLEKAFKNGLVKENHFLCLVLDGSYQAATNLPLYLQEKYFDRIKNNLDKVEIVTDNLQSYLSKVEEGFFDKFSLSDVSGYLSNEQYEYLFQQMIRAAKKGSRFCSRNFIVKRDIPDRFVMNIKREYGLEKELEAQDLSFVYTFVIGEILK